MLLLTCLIVAYNTFVSLKKRDTSDIFLTCLTSSLYSSHIDQLVAVLCLIIMQIWTMKQDTCLLDLKEHSKV